LGLKTITIKWQDFNTIVDNDYTKKGVFTAWYRFVPKVEKSKGPTILERTFGGQGVTSTLTSDVSPWSSIDISKRTTTIDWPKKYATLVNDHYCYDMQVLVQTAPTSGNWDDKDIFPQNYAVNGKTPFIYPKVRTRTLYTDKRRIVVPKVVYGNSSDLQINKNLWEFYEGEADFKSVLKTVRFASFRVVLGTVKEDFKSGFKLYLSVIHKEKDENGREQEKEDFKHITQVNFKFLK
jgi:hypothetical protein